MVTKCHKRTLAAGPSSTKTDLCPFKSIADQVRAPQQEASAQGRAPARLTLWARQPGGSEGRTQRPKRKQIQPIERSGRVRVVFHRKRGEEPTASPTGRRACTGGQRQSYKRAGYLTRASAPACRGWVETATEPRSSSWRGQRCFLEGRESDCGCWATRLGLTHSPQAEWLHSPPVSWGGATGGPQLPSVAPNAPWTQRGPKPPVQVYLLPRPPMHPGLSYPGGYSYCPHRGPVPVSLYYSCPPAHQAEQCMTVCSRGNRNSRSPAPTTSVGWVVHPPRAPSSPL